MHDNSVLAIRIYGLRGMIQEYRKKQKTIKGKPIHHFEDYKHSEIFSIWHIDPETDGSDDSCGYTNPKLSKSESERITNEAEFEYDFYFGRKYSTMNLNAASCYEVIHAIWAQIRWRFYRKQLTPKDLLEISDLASNPTDNLRHLVYESKHDKAEFVRLWKCIFRAQKRIHRRWYEKPKWHVHHWQIRFEWWRDLKRKWARKAAQAKNS